MVVCKVVKHIVKSAVENVGHEQRNNNIDEKLWLTAKVIKTKESMNNVVFAKTVNTKVYFFARLD